MNSDLDEPFVDGFGQEALGQVAGEDLWEERHDIDPQGSLHRISGEWGGVNVELQTKKSGKDRVLPLASFSGCLKLVALSLFKPGLWQAYCGPSE